MCMFEHIKLITGLEDEPETSKKKKKSRYIINEDCPGIHIYNLKEWQKDYEKRREEEKRKAQKRKEKRKARKKKQ